MVTLQCILPESKTDTSAAAGTQVKWNRQDGNLLASSHMNEVLIWDRRVSPYQESLDVG